MSAAEIYFNDRIDSCNRVYDPLSAACGGGGHDSASTWPEIKTWLSAHAGQARTVWIVGSKQEADRRDVMMDTSREWTLALSGGQCDGSVARPVVFAADPSHPYHRITAGTEVSAAWAWRAAYPASADRSLLHGTVYRAPKPKGYARKRSGLLFEGDATVMESLYRSGALREWNENGVRWRYLVYSNRDDKKGAMPADKVYYYGNYFVQGGEIFVLTSDGGAPAAYENSSPRNLIWVPGNVNFLQTTQCAHVRLEGLHFQYLGAVWHAKGDTAPMLLNSRVVQTGIGRYYAVDWNRDSRTKPSTRTTGAVSYNNVWILANGHHNNHRGNNLNFGKTDHTLQALDLQIMAGGHGHSGVDQGESSYAYFIGNRSWGAGGKAVNNKQTRKQFILFNRFQFMQQAYCNYPNVPRGSPLGAPGTCPPETNYADMGETENHYDIQADGTGALVLGNWTSGRAGGITLSGRKNKGLFGGVSENNRVLHNLVYRSVKGDAVKGRSSGGNPGINLYDGPPSPKDPAHGEIRDTLLLNNALVNNRSRTERRDTGLTLSFGRGWTGETLTERGIAFDSNLLFNELGDRKTSGLGKTCKRFEALASVANTVCGATDIPVGNWSDDESPAIDLRPLKGNPGIDRGRWATRALSSGVDSVRLEVADVYAFPDLGGLLEHQQAYFRNAYNTHFCGEVDCGDPTTVGIVPESKVVPVGNGEALLQLGSRIATYCDWTNTGPGTRGVLTLCAPASWPEGEAVNPMPVNGTAPDIWYREYWGIAD